MCLKLGFVIFWQEDFGANAAHKMLVKLTPGSRNWQLVYPNYFNVPVKKKMECSITFIAG
jgi:hypothetical protein